MYGDQMHAHRPCLSRRWGRMGWLRVTRRCASVLACQRHGFLGRKDLVLVCSNLKGCRDVLQCDMPSIGKLGTDRPSLLRCGSPSDQR